MHLGNKKSNVARKIYIFFILIALFVIIFGITPALASKFTDGLKNTAEVGAGYPAAGAVNPVNFLAKLLGSALAPFFLGVTGLIILIYAGYILMTSQGDEQKVQKAKGLITNTVIALLVAYSAYAIVTLIVLFMNKL